MKSSKLKVLNESSGSQFFKITSGKELGPDSFDKSRLVMTFLTNLGVTGILCSLRSALEEKTGKEISESSKLEFIEKVLVTFCVS